VITKLADRCSTRAVDLAEAGIKSRPTGLLSTMSEGVKDLPAERHPKGHAPGLQG